MNRTMEAICLNYRNSTKKKENGGRFSDNFLQRQASALARQKKKSHIVQNSNDSTNRDCKRRLAPN